MTSLNLSCFFATQDTVYIDETVEGNRPIGSKLALGTRAGPSKDFSNALHEMAHLLEIDDARCHLPGWGLKNTSRLGQGPRYQKIARESRVWGIQVKLSQMTKIDYSIDEMASLSLWFDDIYGIPNVNTSADAPSIVKEWILEESLKWTPERILQEWHKKCEVVKTNLA